MIVAASYLAILQVIAAASQDYFYRIRDRYDKRVVSLGVLGDGNSHWRPDHYRESNFGCQLDFTFPIVKLLDFSDNIESLEASTNPFAVIILAHLMTMQTAGDAEHRCQWKLRLLRPLYRRGMTAEDVRKLFRVLDWMMQLPEEIELDFRRELEKYEQENQMPYITSIERLAKNEGREEGREEGRVEGRIEGREKGLFVGKIQVLQQLLADPVEGEEVLLSQPLEQLVGKLSDLQQRLESRN